MGLNILEYIACLAFLTKNFRKPVISWTGTHSNTLKNGPTRRIGMQSKDTDDIDELFETPEMEKGILQLAYLLKLKCVNDRLPTLADMELVYPRLHEKIVFSKWLRRVAIQYIKRK